MNLKKSKLQPNQLEEHLGFQINFQQGKLQITPQKVKGLKKGVGKICQKGKHVKETSGSNLRPGKVKFCDYAFLKAFTGLLVKFLAETASNPWDSKNQIPSPIKDQLKKKLLENWSGRNFPLSPTRFFFLDISSHGWGLGYKKGNFIQYFWRDMEAPL